MKDNNDKVETAGECILRLNEFIDERNRKRKAFLDELTDHLIRKITSQDTDQP